MKSPPLLEIKDFTIQFPRSYGRVAVLDRVAITLKQGESLGLVGESGSGKSLLGLAVLGLLPTTAVLSGSVMLNGVDVVRASERKLAHLRGRIVSYVYQDALSALNPIRRIGAHFKDIWRSAPSEDRRNWRTSTIEVLERVALRHPEKILQSYPAELSGGMRQRILIALAVSRRPRLLVADEPTTALDRSTALEVLNLLDDLRRELRMAILLISHDLGAVRRVCDRIAVIYAGQICEVAQTDALLAAPRHRYSKALLDAVESLSRATYPITGVPGVVPMPEQFRAGCRFVGRCQAARQDCNSDRPLIDREDGAAWCHHPVVYQT
jgi:oligopeptide/dipeptide ABC transporter ATP-binding protein